MELDGRVEVVHGVCALLWQPLWAAELCCVPLGTPLAWRRRDEGRLLQVGCVNPRIGVRRVCASLGFNSLWVGESNPISSGITHGVWGGECPCWPSPSIPAWPLRDAQHWAIPLWDNSATQPIPTHLHPTTPKPPQSTQPPEQRPEIPDFLTASPWSCRQGFSVVS